MEKKSKEDETRRVYIQLRERLGQSQDWRELEKDGKVQRARE
jgi:hypothetical protein